MPTPRAATMRPASTRLCHNRIRFFWPGGFMPEQNHAPSRRRFLQGGSAAAAFTIVRPESVRGSQANSKVAVGLLGVGGRGSYDAAIFHADPRARVTALCDLFDDRIEKGIQQIKTDKPSGLQGLRKAAERGRSGRDPHRHAAVRTPAHARSRGPSAQAHLLREADGRGSGGRQARDRRRP